MNTVTGAALTERREQVFLVLAGVFLSAMTLLNVIGITKFIQLGPFALAVGVLPYPITFLCTDLVSELFGKKRAKRACDFVRCQDGRSYCHFLGMHLINLKKFSVKQLITRL